ncbi:hypothetical protein JOF29_003622 [Kribbella aluminosa]|uniref:Uncharacterized protein n=1 Tax=Kribbella aluminosa TaxID=416017 RepID=A0ABS4ULX6_9ACTN|nr:hypothetical protein [Kribbella aluminosa]
MAAGIGTAYWLTMSPYSQLFGSFPYRGRRDGRTVA